MLKKRIIPRLDIKNSNLVKGVHMEGLRVVGKPEDAAKKYYNDGADEIIFQDVVASLYCRNSILDIIEKTSKNIFIPMTVGGGIRSIEDVNMVLRAGADKVAVNTACVERPELISELVEHFGASTITIAIDAQKQSNGIYEVLTEYGRQNTDINAVDWALRVEELGAGEIVLTSINMDGTNSGYDIELYNQVTSKVNIPVIASGGAGNIKHIFDVINMSGVDAVAIASLLHYQYCRNIDIDSENYIEGNISFIKNLENEKSIHGNTIQEIKSKLIEDGMVIHNNIYTFVN